MMEYTVSAVMEKTDDFTLSIQDSTKYLNLYVGESDWEKHLKILYGRLLKKHGAAEAKELMRKTIACTILLPTHDKSKIPTPVENLLFWTPTYTQFNERDWVLELQEVIEADKDIEGWRNQCLSLGVVHPLEYSPVTREAFNRLFTKAEEAGAVNDSNKKDMIRRFQNLVLAYGGNVICYMFVKEDYKINRKILNWRSNYFFEKLIFDTYTPEQVFKIKKQELAKTNPKLVKSVRV